MKEKKLPQYIRNRLLYSFFQTKIGRITSNWIAQGMLYMNPVEIVYKMVLDLLLTLAIQALIIRNPSIPGWLVAWLAAHTLNWIFNGQLIAMLRHLDWGRNDPVHFIRYIEGLEKRARGKSYLAGVASFGSLSRGGYKQTSDIDIRVLLAAGAVNHLRAAHFCFIERVRAALSLFPLDLYAFDLGELKTKMKPDEVPVIFADPHGMLKGAYGDTVPFTSFDATFRKTVLGE
jgi:hypothetical protein